MAVKDYHVLASVLSLYMRNKKDRTSVLKKQTVLQSEVQDVCLKCKSNSYLTQLFLFCFGLSFEFGKVSLLTMGTFHLFLETQILELGFMFCITLQGINTYCVNREGKREGRTVQGIASNPRSGSGSKIFFGIVKRYFSRLQSASYPESLWIL